METEHHKKQFRGCWIPAEIIDLLQDGELSCQEIVLLAMIDSLVTPERGCYASNNYLGKILGVSATRTSQIISGLIDKGLVIKVSFDGRRRHLETIWSKIDPEKVDSEWLKNKLSEQHARNMNVQDEDFQEPDFSHTKPDFSQTKGCVSQDERLSIAGRKAYVIEKEIEKEIEKNTQSPAERGDGLTGFNLNGRTSRDTDDQNSQYARSAAKRLYDGLAKHRKIMRKVNIGKWSVEINRFLDESPITRDEFDRLLNWYVENIDTKFVPKAYSAGTFCERFVDIRDAYERTQISEEEIQDRERRGIPSKPLKCIIRNPDGTETVKYAHYED